jgi:2-phosphosulfolactate phosphatase
VRSLKAETLLASSFVCAGATVRYIKQQSPARVTLVSTSPDGEDQACAEYIAALLRDERPDVARLLDQVRQTGQQRIDYAVSGGLITEAQRDEFAADLDCCTALDRFDFAMVVQRRGALLVVETAH